MTVVVNQQAIPTLEKGGGATVEGTLSADGNTVVVDFEECYTAPGQYFLNIPEGALKVNGRELLPVTFRFNIAGSIESFYEQITINPAEGEVESLQNFVISFPEYVGEIEYGSKAILTNTTTGATYRTDMEDVRYNVLAFFPEGKKKLIYQTPWYEDDDRQVVGGLIEFSIILPDDMPHYDRG